MAKTVADVLKMGKDVKMVDVRFIDLPDPVEAIKFEMEHKGLTVKDLEPMIGKSNRVYEVLNRKRALTLRMIQKLHQELGIPAESLIKQSA